MDRLPRDVERQPIHKYTALTLTADYGPRWRAHYVRVGSEADLNDELITWLQEAHDTVGLQSDLRRAPP